jgi:hypothetical protein
VLDRLGKMLSMEYGEMSSRPLERAGASWTASQRGHFLDRREGELSDSGSGTGWKSRRVGDDSDWAGEPRWRSYGPVSCIVYKGMMRPGHRLLDLEAHGCSLPAKQIRKSRDG